MAGGTLFDAVDTSFGSGRNGLVWGYCLRPGQPAVPTDADAAANLLSAPPEDEPWFLWLHFSLSNAATER